MNDLSAPTVGSAPLPERTLSPWERAVALFARPAEAWVGLATRTQWWIPLIVTLAVQLGSVAFLYERASMPDAQARMDRMVDAGILTEADAERSMEQSGGTRGIGIAAVAIVVTTGLSLLILPSLLAFGMSFLLGAKMRYRHALGVFCWAGLIRIPEQLLVCALAWYQETIEGVHVGWGAFLPVPEEVSRGYRLLAGFLDSLGPFALWYLVVMALGASALSGAGRKPAIAVVIGMYTLIVLAFIGIGAILPFPM